MKNLNIDDSEYLEMNPQEAQKIKHLKWILDEIHLNPSAKKIYEKDLMDMVVDVKVKIMKCCEI